MQNGYFQVVRTPGGYGLQIFQPKDGGEDVRLQEVMDYLDRQSIPYDSMSIKKAILAEEDRRGHQGSGTDHGTQCNG